LKFALKAESQLQINATVSRRLPAAATKASGAGNDCPKNGEFRFPTGLPSLVLLNKF
jgi:hypothetical protein